MADKKQQQQDQSVEVNHHEPLPSLIDALPTMRNDTAEQVVVRKMAEQHVKRQLKSLRVGKASFENTGVVEIMMSEDGDEPRPTPIYIRSIPAHILVDLSRQREIAATIVSRKFDPETGELGKDTHGFEVEAERFHKLNRELLYHKVIYGLDMVLEDEDGLPIWDNSQRYKYEKNPENLVNAVEALKNMGLQQTQLEQIANAIDALSDQAQHQDKEELEKN